MLRARFRSLTAAVAAALALPLTLTTALLPATAGAQEKKDFGERGEFILSANRLFPLFAYTSNYYGTGNTSRTVTGTSLSFFYGSNSLAVGAGTAALGNPTFYSVPRIGLDYTIAPHLTIGGELVVFFTLGGSSSVAVGGNSTTSTSNPSGNEFGIAPRIGYIVDLSGPWSIWLRGGFSYYLANASATDNAFANCNQSGSVNAFGLDLDPQVVLTPFEHLSFMAGPALDWGFTGGQSATIATNAQCTTSTTTSQNYNVVNFSLTAGMLGWF